MDYETVLYYRLQILIEIGKGWFFEKVMKWSRHARKIFRWHYNRLEFAVSSLWKTLGRVVVTAAAARVLIHTYQHLYEHLPTGLEIELSSVTGMQQHLPTYLLNSLNQLLRAQEKCTRARALIKEPILKSLYFCTVDKEIVRTFIGYIGK